MSFYCHKVTIPNINTQIKLPTHDGTWTNGTEIQSTTLKHCASVQFSEKKTPKEELTNVNLLLKLMSLRKHKPCYGQKNYNILTQILGERPRKNLQDMKVIFITVYFALCHAFHYNTYL